MSSKIKVSIYVLYCEEMYVSLVTKIKLYFRETAKVYCKHGNFLIGYKIFSQYFFKDS